MKSFEWLVLVSVLTFYLIVRSRHLVMWERLTASLVPAGLAYAGSAQLSPLFGGNELIATIFIMTLGPAIIGAILTFGEDEEFVKKVLQDYSRKLLRLKKEESQEDE